MPTRRIPATPLVLAAALAGCALSVTLGAGTATAHGSMQNPLSRVEGCYLEGPEHPVSAACRAAVATGGTAALYDWMSLRIGDAAGRHREIIPDGKLCSAGTDMFRGLDLPRADWPATNLTAGADFTFRFRATAPHKGTFQLFLTNRGHDPAKPLAWADLDAQPFLSVTDPQLVDGSYLLPGRIPAGRTGRQLVYAIWQRSDSPEAFYSCSDVVFDGSGATPGSAAVPAATGAGHSHPPATTATIASGLPATATVPAAPATGTGPAAAADAPAAAGGGPAAAAAPAVAVPSTTAAAATSTGPSATAGPAARTGNLAQTGSARSLGLLASVGASFLLAGATMAVLRRGRRTRGAHAR
ncbi:lytic polysaccharide monooxygenase [Kitasatospora sp. NBC_00315]|uniref:lytic polysaccharide monooxygenase auxiliary activity family 9 protein n=1 Tax=Kitasatospora sp. NBC_00315 TaxID=2975963 RepID=UPI003251243B